MEQQPQFSDMHYVHTVGGLSNADIDKSRH